ncbi:MAG: nonstructural protein [Microviridae sp.]|nr:MAG: nonstructural protein [Microviridae sp.]
MILTVCSVRDRATDSYGNPMFVVAPGQAVRGFADEINRNAPENQLFKHPADFDLFVLGTFNTDTGLFDCGVPRQIAIGKDMVNVSQ